MKKVIRDLFLLRDDVVFLNHGSFGACPREVFENYQKWQLELEKQPVEFLSEDRGNLNMMKGVRENLAKEFRTSSENLVLVTNATTGLKIVAKSLPLKPGDEILTTDHEYGALEKTWEFIARKTDSKFVKTTVPIPLLSAEQFTESVWSGVTKRTRILFLSHITSATSLLFPISELIKRAKERGILTIIDGAHVPGHINLNLETLGADFYSGNCHKWMLTPKGSAFLYVKPEMQKLIEPLVVSHGWNPDSEKVGAFGNSQFIDSMEFQGTRDIAAFLSIPDAIRFLEKHRWSEIQKDCHNLAWDASNMIGEITGLPPLVSEEMRGGLQMVSIQLPECNVETLKTRLYDEFHIEIPVFQWKNLFIIRISIQGYNTMDDVKNLLDALKILIPQM